MPNNLAAVHTEVVTLTNRSDLSAQIDQAIKLATLSLHQREFFQRDIFEVFKFNTGATDNYLSIPIVTLAPTNFRAMSYIKKQSATTDTQDTNTIFYKEIKPAAMNDEYFVFKQNVWYLAGANIIIRSSDIPLYISYAYFQNPLVGNDPNYSSWIADNHLYCVAAEASRIIFAQTGNVEKMKEMSVMVQQLWGDVLTTNLKATGY